MTKGTGYRPSRTIELIVQGRRRVVHDGAMPNTPVCCPETASIVDAALT